MEKSKFSKGLQIMLVQINPMLSLLPSRPHLSQLVPSLGAVHLTAARWGWWRGRRKIRGAAGFPHRRVPQQTVSRPWAFSQHVKWQMSSLWPLRQGSPAWWWRRLAWACVSACPSGTLGRNDRLIPPALIHVSKITSNVHGELHKQPYMGGTAVIIWVEGKCQLRKTHTSLSLLQSRADL